jgi:hypothetical protein
LGKKLESTSWFLGCRTVGLMGLKHISYAGFSIKNKMADLNTCPYLGFSIKNKIQKSDGYCKERGLCGDGCFVTLYNFKTFKYSYQNKLFNLQVSW